MSLVFALLALSSAPKRAEAWGILKHTQGPYARAYLFHPILERKRIDYCLSVDESRFDRAGMAAQLRSALAVWLEPLLKLGISGVRGREVDCQTGDFDLRVFVGTPETEEARMQRSHQSPAVHPQTRRFHSQITINADYEHEYDGRRYRTVDFSSLLLPGTDLPALLRRISRTEPTDVETLSRELRLGFGAVFHSSYRVLIHELGHAFGLCDTYDGEREAQCDPRYSSATHPSSMMLESNRFHLTDDDRAGIRALFRREMAAGQ